MARATPWMAARAASGDSHMRSGYRRCHIHARPGSVNAIRHYNNACWYVAEVLTIARRYQEGA